MTTKPDDIPKDVWDEAFYIMDDFALLTLEDDEGLIQRAISKSILKAKNDAYEESCAEVRKLRLQTALDGGMVENPYIDVHKVSQAIRNLKHEIEV